MNRRRAFARYAPSRTRRGPVRTRPVVRHHHRRGFVARSPVTTPFALAGACCESSCERSPQTDAPMTRDAFDRHLLIHESRTGTHRIVRRPSLLRITLTSCDARTPGETGADGVSRHRCALWWLLDGRPPEGVVLERRRARCSTSDVPVADPGCLASVFARERTLGFGRGRFDTAHRETCGASRPGTSSPTRRWSLRHEWRRFAQLASPHGSLARVSPRRLLRGTLRDRPPLRADRRERALSSEGSTVAMPLRHDTWSHPRAL